MKLKTLAISTSMAKSNCLPTSRGRGGDLPFETAPKTCQNLPVIPRHPIPKQRMTTEPKCYAVEVIEPSGNHYLKISLDSYGHVFLNEVQHTNNLKPPAKHTFFGIKKTKEADLPPPKTSAKTRCIIRIKTILTYSSRTATSIAAWPGTSHFWS